MGRTIQVMFGFFRFFLAFLWEELLVRVPFYKRMRGKQWKQKNPQRLRGFCVDMGGAFVKFGQFFSIRSDILPRAYCRALDIVAWSRISPIRMQSGAWRKAFFSATCSDLESVPTSR